MKKVVLAYSGGLDTSIILAWLRDAYNCEVITFTADLGQKDDFQVIKQKAQDFSVEKIYVDDLKEEFVRDFVFPMFRINPLYEGSYLLGTAIARPLIAKRQVEIARENGAYAVSHGATGKGNDQVRFELGYYSCEPDITVISPWRQWDFTSRSDLLDYAKSKGIPVSVGANNETPYSIDSNLLHNSFEGNALEDPDCEADLSMLIYCVTPEKAPDEPSYITIEFANGDPIALDGKELSPAAMLSALNDIGGKNGIGCIDIVENRYVGLKSRGVYETPGGTVLLHAHRAIESITLDGKAAHLKDEIMPKYVELIYNGYWWSPERLMLQALIDESQKNVHGKVVLKLYKGSVMVVKRSSPKSLYNQAMVSFEENDNYDQHNTDGFIKLNALRLRNWARM